MALGITNSDTGLLQKIYSVGSLYFNTTDINPADIFGFGTWERVSQNMTLWGASANGEAGTTKAAGLPNVKDDLTYFSNIAVSLSSQSQDTIRTNRALHGLTIDDQSTGLQHQPSSGYDLIGGLSIDLSKGNSIYGNSSTVQPPALVVNIWKRTA